MYDLVSYKETVDSAFEIIKNCNWYVGEKVYQVVNNELKEDTIIHIEFKVSTHLVDYQSYPQSANIMYGLYIDLKGGGSFRLEEFNRKFSSDMAQAVELEKQRLNDAMEILKRKIEYGTIVLQ